MKRKTPSDVYDINHKTGALVIGKNRLDDYAAKFLNKYCKEALIKPMPIPVEDIINKMNLVVKEERLSSNLDIFGCCLLVDGEIKVYNPETNEYMEKFFEQGTIVIDSLAAEVYGEGSKRNTLIHESLHWEKDKTFFEILRIKNKKLTEEVYPIMLRQSERFYEPPKRNQTKENEVMWLEWQAHKLAPRILMPFSTLKEKALELISREAITCDEIIQELSAFFKVSRESTKYRLFEVGLEKELSNISDFDRIFEDQLSKNEFIKLSYTDAFKMIEKNELLSNWIDEGKFVFVDGYFVIANQEYIVFKDGKLSLSAKAKRNLKRCVINIRVKRYIEHGINRKKVAFLLKDDGVDKRFYLFKPEDQTHLNREITPDELYGYFSDSLDKENIEDEIEFERLITDPQTTLCECLWYSFKKNDWMLPEKFNEETELHKNYHGRIKRNNYNNMGKDILWPICIGLKYSVRTIQKIFKKSDNKLKEFEEPDRLYILILEKMPGINLRDFNSILEKRNMKVLGSDIRYKN